MTIDTHIAATTFNVNQSSDTAITCPLGGARMVQVYIRPTSTQQAFTITLPSGGTIEIASGQAFCYRFAEPVDTSEPLGTVRTATGSAVLQVVAMREDR